VCRPVLLAAGGKRARGAETKQEQHMAGVSRRGEHPFDSELVGLKGTLPTSASRPRIMTFFACCGLKCAGLPCLLWVARVCSERKHSKSNTWPVSRRGQQER
jgi:hypothetical protein